MTAETQPIMINRAPWKGQTEAVPGLRVALMIQGDRHGYKCYQRRVEGTVEAVTSGDGKFSRTIVVRLDESQPYVGERVNVWSFADDIMALDA